LEERTLYSRDGLVGCMKTVITQQFRREFANVLGMFVVRDDVTQITDNLVVVPLSNQYVDPRAV
jgi:hypothetical protein